MLCDFVAHLLFGVLEGGVEHFVEQCLCFFGAAELAEHAGAVELEDFDL